MQYYSSYGIPIRGVSENQTASNSLSQLPHFQDLIQPISNNYTKQNEKKIEKEKIEKQYQQYFKDVLPDVQMTKKQCLTPDVLEKHRVTQIKKGDGHLWAKSVNQCDSYVQLSKCLHSGMQCVYNVFIGEFFLAVNVLHLHINSYQNINKQKILGKGTYGLVRKLQIDGKQIALKKISFLKKPINQAHLKASKIINQEDFANEHEIKLAVREYAFYKICSMLKIGPQVIFEDSYDLICYNDCVEFKMQLCQNISQIVEVKKYEKDIKRCLATLHSLKIIHKDMKKTNTLYSKAFNSYVLADFGLAHTVIQQIWEKTQTNFSGTWGNASPQMQKIFKKREPQFINLYMNDIYGLKITLKELYDSWKPIQKKYQKNVMSDYKSASQECSQNVSYEDSDYNQNSSQESTKKIENQYYMRGGNKNYMNDNKKSQEILSQRIDYYQIKALSRYLDYYKKQSFKISTNSLQNILRQVIGKQEDYASLMPELLKLITPIIQTLYKNQQFNLMNIRNCIRIFGLRSKEFLNQLNKLSQKNSNPNINCQPIKYYLKQAQKNNKIVIKKFDNHILNMYRHLCLRNQISLSNSLRSLLKNYLEENPECKKKNQEILIMVLQGLTFQGLTQTESFQILQMISAIFYKKSASVNKNNYRTCCIDLMQKLFEHLKERKRVSVRSLQNMARIYMNMQFDDKAKHYIEKISEHRKDMQRKLRQEKKLQKSEEQEIKGKIINSKLIQWNYLAHEHKFEQALQKLIKLYKQFTEYQIKDQSLKINILDNIVAISIRLNLITQAQFYNNLLKAQLQKYCLPSKVSIQFSLFFSFRGQILKHYGKHEEALQNFENVLQYTNDPLRGPNYIKIVKNAFFNIADCHNKMGDRQKCLMYLQKNYQFSKTYEHFQNEQTVQVIQHIIINMLLLKKSSYQLAFYFHELTNLKAQIFNSPFCPLTEEKKRIIPLFSFGAISQNYMIDQDYLLMARKIILPFAEQHMPLFSNWYIRQNQLLLNHYHKRQQYIKSCRYLWNSLKYVSNPQKNDKYYQKLQIFIQLLIRCNSSRRAWRYLKKYAYYIPEKFMNYKLSMFKTLSKLSSQLNTTEQNFYHFIQKYKAIKSLDNLMEAQFKFQQTFHNVIYRKIYERKLKMIELHIEEKRAVIINMDENYSQNPEPQLPNPINRESSVTTQDIIRRKLSLYKSNRQKHKLINVVQ